jgi:hypothetical protein
MDDDLTYEVRFTDKAIEKLNAIFPPYDNTYEVRLGNPPEPKTPSEIAFAKYDPSLPVRMVIRAKPSWFPAKWWLKMLKWLRNENQQITL